MPNVHLVKNHQSDTSSKDALHSAVTKKKQRPTIISIAKNQILCMSFVIAYIN